MLDKWKALSYTTRFSIVACIIMFVLGFLGMGITGALLYFLVFFALGDHPHFDTWHGDWVWPALLLVSWAFPIGFLFAGLAWHYLKTRITSKILLRVVYGLILWLWAALLWFLTIKINAGNMADL